MKFFLIEGSTLKEKSVRRSFLLTYIELTNSLLRALKVYFASPNLSIVNKNFFAEKSTKKFLRPAKKVLAAIDRLCEPKSFPIKPQ
jgi:hypothetical protein